jgi:hypothetical protein
MGQLIVSNAEYSGGGHLGDGRPVKAIPKQEWGRGATPGLVEDSGPVEAIGYHGLRGG